MNAYVLKDLDGNTLCVSSEVTDISNHIHNNGEDETYSIEVWESGSVIVVEDIKYSMLTGDIIYKIMANEIYASKIEVQDIIDIDDFCDNMNGDVGDLTGVEREFSTYEQSKLKELFVDFCRKNNIKEVWSDYKEMFKYVRTDGNVTFCVDDGNEKVINILRLYEYFVTDWIYDSHNYSNWSVRNINDSYSKKYLIYSELNGIVNYA